ncbi:hypothetical protein Bca101_070200 [Brassica carinata]
MNNKSTKTERRRSNLTISMSLYLSHKKKEMSRRSRDGEGASVWLYLISLPPLSISSPVIKFFSASLCHEPRRSSPLYLSDFVLFLVK